MSIYGTYGLFPLTYEYNYQIKSNTRLVRCIGSKMGRFWGRGRGFLNISHCPGSFVLESVPFSRRQKKNSKINFRSWQIFVYLVFHITTTSLRVLQATFEDIVYLRELGFPWVDCGLFFLSDPRSIPITRSNYVRQAHLRQCSTPLLTRTSWRPRPQVLRSCPFFEWSSAFSGEK